MTWLQPWAAWLLAGLPLIVLLYLLKVRRQPVLVSTLLFWRRVLEEHRRRALFQKLRNVLSLLLWMLIFALIVAAIARPSFDRLVREGAATVVVIDARARMQAVDEDGTTQWQKATRAALHAVAEVSGSRPMALIAMGPQPSVLAPFTSDERALRTALEKLTVTDATGNIGDALNLAESLLATRGGARNLVLYTDRHPGPVVTRSHPSLVVHAASSPKNNVAIVRFATRALPASPQTSEVLVELANYGASDITTNLEVRYDDRLLDVKPVALTAGAKETRVFPSLPRPGGNARGHLTARIDVKDALPLDNEAFALLPPPRPVRVLLVTKGNVFLEKALSAEPTVSFELIAPEGWNATLTTKFDVTVYDEFVPAGWESSNALFVGRTPFDSGAAPLLNPVLTDIDAVHPILRMVDFGKVTILRARSLAVPAAAEEWRYNAPLRSFENPLLIVGERQGAKKQRVAALGVDLTASDLPLRVAFPLLITNSVHWLGATAAEPRLPVRCGETIALAADERIVAPIQSSGFFQPLKNGFYELDRDGRREWIAVNTASEDESDLRGGSPTESSVSDGPLLPRMAAGWLPAWPPWRWLALGALLLATTEWSLFHRRRTE
jgi:hypothetical protein